MTAAAQPLTMAASLVDAGLLTDIKRFGAADVSACFSCGLCTATCPLVSDDATFPRRLIRYAQLGLRERLLASPELWACYACGDCSESCPQQAEPSEFMAATRRYAIAAQDRLGLARLLFTRPLVSAVVTVLLAAFLALFMYSAHGPMDGTTLAIFDFIPEGLVHDTGVIVMIAVFGAGLLGVATMVRRVAGGAGVGLRALVAGRSSVRRALVAAWSALAVDSLAQRRYRRDCDSDTTLPWFRRRWFIHAATMWGFLGLLAATVLDYGLALAGIKETGTPVPIWYPVRLLGTLAGLLLVYGTSMLMWRRWRRADRALRSSTAADWTLLVLLELAGVSGFALELALYLPQPPAWGYWVFLFHVALAMELVLLAPFIKFAHAVYRPVALLFIELRRHQP